MKKTTLITILSVLLIIVGLLATLLLDDSLGSRIVNLVTIVTAIIGAVALFLQFKKDKEVNTASFIMDYSKSFYNDYDLYDVFEELEKTSVDPSYKTNLNKYHSKIVVYLEWIESLASLIERNVIDLYTIDNVISYRFFLIVNNKYVQESELVKYAEFYRGTYYLYDRWYKYEIKRGLEIPLQETGLHLTANYDKTLEIINDKIKHRLKG